jgi:hypothetical protein
MRMAQQQQQQQRRRNNNAIVGPVSVSVGAARRFALLLVVVAVLGAPPSLVVVAAAFPESATLPSARHRAAAALAAAEGTATTETRRRRTRGDTIGTGTTGMASLRDATDSKYRRHRLRLQQRGLQQDNKDDKKTQPPSEEPSHSPTLEPTVSPAPSAPPTQSPAPSVAPSSEPSASPSAKPSDVPTSVPSTMPSASPTVSHAPTTSPQPTSVAFTKTQTERQDDGFNGTSYETLYSCSTADLPNDKYLYPLISNEMSFQYRAIVHQQVFDPSSSSVHDLVAEMEVQIQKGLAWHYLHCDYQSDFVYQGFYVHSISSDVPDEAEKDACDDAAASDGTSSGGNSTSTSTSNGGDALGGSTHCLTVTARYKLQLVLYPERRSLQQSSGTTSGSSSSSTQQWGMDGRVVKDVGTFLTQLLQDEQTWQDVPAVTSTQFRGFVNSASAEGGDGTGTNGGNEAATSNSPSSSQGSSNYLAVLPWIAIVLAVLVLGAALFLVLRHRKMKNRTNSSSDKVLPSGQLHEQTHLEDSSSDAANTNPSGALRPPALFDYGDESTAAGYDDVRGVLSDRRRGMPPDDSTIRSELGYSIDPMDYSNIGPTSSFDSEWTDANRSIFNLDKAGTAASTSGDADPPTDAPLPKPEPTPAPPRPEEEEVDTTPRSARLINAGLAMRAPHVGSARNRGGRTANAAAAPNSNNPRFHHDDTINL